jgi:hypothetical protein
MNNFNIKKDNEKDNEKYKIIETGSNKQMLLPENCKIFITCKNANIIKEYFKIFSISAFIGEIKKNIMRKNYNAILLAELKDISKIDLEIIREIVSTIINNKNLSYENYLDIIKQIKDNIILNDEQLKIIKDNIDNIDIKSNIDKEIKNLFRIDIFKIIELLKNKVVTKNKIVTEDIENFISIDIYDLNNLLSKIKISDNQKVLESLESLIDIKQKVLNLLIDIKAKITKLLDTKIALEIAVNPQYVIELHNLLDNEINSRKYIKMSLKQYIEYVIKITF